jgi:hypothetical protein
MTHPRNIAASLIVAVVAAAFLVAATTDERIPDQRYLDYAGGFATYTPKIKSECGKSKCHASAVCIADHWAMTAAHVLEDAGETTLTLGERTWVVDRIVVHPDFFKGTHGVADIALLHVSEPFGLTYYPPLSDGAEVIGDVVSIVGYGITGRMNDGHSVSDGRLRAGTNHIERFEAGMIVCTASPGRSPLEACIAPGDSGGPMFCRGRLTGINSMTFAAKGPLKSKTGEESGHTRVWLHRDWIREVTQ